MTNYLLAVITMLCLIIAVMFGLLRVQSGKIQKLSQENGRLDADYSSCIDINKANIVEYEKIITATNNAKKTIEDAKAKAEAEVRQQRKRIWEILNAKDNGAIPGVIQRTLDGMRDRASRYQDRENTAFDPIGNTIMPVPS